MKKGTLYVVATPLGNLGDITERARNLLRTVPVVAAEDTRRTRILLEHIGASPRLISFHSYSDQRRRDQVIEQLEAGTDVALVSDAGTPTVSDPGISLVSEATESGIAVVTVPGPSAVVAALSISGLPADRFTFFGFLPRKGKDRREMLDLIVQSPWTVVIYEAANRLVRTLKDLADLCTGSTRQAVVARELTKKHEELRPGTLDSLAVYYGEHPPKGEVTVVVAGSKAQRPAVPPEDVEARGRELVSNGMSGRDAANELSREMGISRNEAYRVINSL